MNFDLNNCQVTIPAKDYNLLLSKIDSISEHIEFLKKSDNRLVATEELLGHIPISKSTLQTYRIRNLIRYTKVGRKVMFSIPDVIEDLKKINKM